MSREKRRRKERRTAQPAAPAKIVFSFAAIRMLKDALRLAEQAFARTTEPEPNLEFGKTTLRGLQQKIDDMLQGEDWEKKTPFDYNETHILYAAIHMYLIMLTETRNEQHRPLCLQLYKYFGGLVESLQHKHAKTQ